MPGKRLHHFNRGLAIGFEIVGLCGILFLLFWGYLIFRLSHGPMEVGFLTKRIERAVNAEQHDFRFSAGTTVLTWGGRGHPFMFEMRHVQVTRADGTPVLSVERIGVRLSKRHLLFGALVPRVIRVYGPALRIVRDAAGHFALNVGDADADDRPPAAASGQKTPPPALADTPEAVDVLRSFLAQIRNDSRSTFLGGLDEVRVTDAALLYQDKALGVSWKSGDTDIDFRRAGRGLEVGVLAAIGRVPATAALVRGDFLYDWTTRRAEGTVAFSGLDPALLAQKSPELKMFSGAAVPLSGRVFVALDRNFIPQGGRFAFSSGAGKFSLAGFFPAPVPVESARLYGTFDTAAGDLTVRSFSANLGGPRVTGSGTVTPFKDDSGGANGYDIVADAVLRDMPLDSLKTYWPPPLAADARGWVTGHLSGGMATQATLHLALRAPVRVCLRRGAPPWEGLNMPVVKRVGGRIAFHGITVDYFPPLMPVKKVRGAATYDSNSFDLDISGGALGDMRVTHSKIAITGLDAATDTRHSKIDISVALKGPLGTALKVLESKPLGYPQKLGLDTKNAAGDAAVDVDFKFPLYNALKLDDVAVTAKAALDNILLKDVAAGMPLSGGPVALTLGQGALDISGKGVLGTMPVTFDWKKNFLPGAPFDREIRASLPLDDPSMARLGVPAFLQVTGDIPATLTYTEKKTGTAALVFNGDITAAGFTVPAAGYTKQPGVGGTLGMTMEFKNGVLQDINDLNLETDKAQVNGDLTFAPDGKTLSSAALPQVKMGKTDVAVDLDRIAGAYDVSITGPSFDASRILSDGVAPKSDAAAAEETPPVNLAMKVVTLYTGNGGAIGNLSLSMRRNAWGRIDSATATGTAGGKPLKLSYLPGLKGHALHFVADNAGAALSAIGISDGVRGGRLVVSGSPDANDPGRRDMHGTVYMMNFSLVNVPVLGRLLNALSLSGFMELLNGKGIAFHKMRCDFWWKDKGEPQTQKNIRLITIRHGETSGASLGLTFKGVIDDWNNTVDMSGTIIPVSDINKLVSVIPIVGNILTGGGHGIFAATYTVKGSKADPDVTVNPLSVLAPGILRRLFFEK